MLRVSRTALCGIVAILALQCRSGVAQAKSQEMAAISATVTGNDQQVGFRAMIMKQAIAYDLAGTARNQADSIVAFTLQGSPKRIEKAVETIRAGTSKSSGIAVKTSPAVIDPALHTFTVIDWTSTSRQITTPYTLVFSLRDSDETISASDAKDVWHQILRTTLKGDDLNKLGDDE